MAAPPEVTLDNLTGKFTMNKSISTDPDSALALQGIGWLTRKAIGLASVTLIVKEYTDDAGVVHIDIDQIVTGGLKGSSELRTMDWVRHDVQDNIFGSVVGQSKFCKMSEVGEGIEPSTMTEDEKTHLTTGWDDEFASPDSKVMFNHVVNEKSDWVAFAVWGFKVIGPDNLRRYVRQTTVRKISTGESKTLVLAYDWLP